jgi:hypothetical protein
MHEPSVVLQVVRADCLASLAHAVIRQGIVTLQHLDAEEQVELPVCDLDDVPLSMGGRCPSGASAPTTHNALPSSSSSFAATTIAAASFDAAVTSQRISSTRCTCRRPGLVGTTSSSS